MFAVSCALSIGMETQGYISTTVGGNLRDIVHLRKFGYKTEVEERIEIRERLALRKVKEEEHLADLRWVKKRDRNENVFARPNGLHEHAGTAISCRGPGPAKKRYTGSREREKVDARMRHCGKAVESGTHISWQTWSWRT